ncbi:MAG: geranylgeranylglyceryl/heptaprenylglyceryl phosphate synthase [Candidatus Thermoplasmatota archaeon]
MSLTENIINEVKNKKLHFALLDPEDQTPRRAGLLAKTAEDAGSSAIMVGGSTLSSCEQVDETVRSIKRSTNIPVVIFPSAAKFLSRYADGIFFMSLLNSRNLDYVIREHVKAAPFIKKSGLEPLSMGYLIVEPGMVAGEIGEVDLVKRDDVGTAVGYALSAQYLGMNFFYLEAGSGASQPVSDEMISAVKENTDISLIVGGGIRDAETAESKTRAGADIIVTGTALEEDTELDKTLTGIIEAIQK